MKKLLMLMMALALVAFALPALAQNSINGVPSAGNTIGNSNVNSQFQNANVGDQSNASFMNKSTITATGNLSENNTTVDNSSGFLNKSTVTVDNVGNATLSNNILSADDNSFGTINKSNISVSNALSGNNAFNTTNNASVTASLTDSLNSNTLYFGNMTNAWTNQHQFEHQYDHQLAFGTTFQNANGTFYIPISNTHMEQTNTGISAGSYAGAAVGANLINMGNANVQGMFTLTANMGGVGTNQAVLNAVTAFSAP